VSDALAAIVTNASCALLAFDSGSSTLRPLQPLHDSFLPAEKGSKILAASVSPDSDCVAVFRRAPAEQALTLEVYHALGSLPLSSFKYGLQPRPCTFSGSATSLSWRGKSDGSVIAACTAHLFACASSFSWVVLQVVTAHFEHWPLSKLTNPRFPSKLRFVVFAQSASEAKGKGVHVIYILFKGSYFRFSHLRPSTEYHIIAQQHHPCLTEGQIFSLL
jgi:hypothetical protein